MYNSSWPTISASTLTYLRLLPFSRGCAGALGRRASERKNEVPPGTLDPRGARSLEWTLRRRPTSLFAVPTHVCSKVKNFCVHKKCNFVGLHTLGTACSCSVWCRGRTLANALINPSADGRAARADQELHFPKFRIRSRDPAAWPRLIYFVYSPLGPLALSMHTKVKDASMRPCLITLVTSFCL